MTITINETFDGRQADVSEDSQSTYTRTFEAHTGDPRIGAVLVKAALSLAIGQPYSTGFTGEADAGAVLLRVALSCNADDGCTWAITASYGPWTERPREENPLDEPEELEYGGEQFERIADVDVDGNAIVNSAGDYFDPPVVMDDSRPLFTITRNEASFSASVADSYRDTTNDATFFGFAAGTVKCGFITAVRKWHAKVPGHFYWTVKYPFYLNRDGWTKSLLDQGLRKAELVGATLTRKQITIDGQLATSPVLLNGTGGVLAPNGTPVYLEYRVYPESDFSTFGFTGA
jgi:hypothetical protein